MAGRAAEPGRRRWMDMRAFDVGATLLIYHQKAKLLLALSPQSSPPPGDRVIGVHRPRSQGGLSSLPPQVASAPAEPTQNAHQESCRPVSRGHAARTSGRWLQPACLVTRSTQTHCTTPPFLSQTQVIFAAARRNLGGSRVPARERNKGGKPHEEEAPSSLHPPARRRPRRRPSVLLFCWGG